MEMSGVSLLKHEERDACAEEWPGICKRLSTPARRAD
jgi:hypothetical protein